MVARYKQVVYFTSNNELIEWQNNLQPNTSILEVNPCAYVRTDGIPIISVVFETPNEAYKVEDLNKHWT